VALIVLLVPELLSGPGRSAPTATRRADEPPMRSYTINLAEGSVKQTVVPEPEALAAKVVQPPAPAENPPATQQTPAPAETPANTEAVKPTPPPATPVHTEPPPVTGWSIQLGSFVSRDNAQRLVKELKGKGFTAFMLEGNGHNGKVYRVRVGPAADRAAAAALATKLRSVGQPGSVVPYP